MARLGHLHDLAADTEDGEKCACSIAEAVRFSDKLTLISDTPTLDCQLLLSACLDKTKSWMIAHDDYCLTPNELQSLTTLLNRRLKGEPIAYILGSQGFWDMELTVTTDTLIPRPETELLVETILATYDSAPRSIIDLGTGTGAIPIALQRERPNWELYATDHSFSALQVAKTNAAEWAASKVSFLLGDWLQSLGSKKFDLIVSNPPYIEIDDQHLQALHFEPQTALIAQDRGLADLTSIIRQSRRCLKTKGYLVLEHGYNQQSDVTNLLIEAGYEHFRLLEDYNNTPRAVIARL
ncbi:MAG: release factor glutamine methyltransferase [Candidatus Azotimanducaceae bacterium]|jgi:release factor glutamine methyltransferase